MNIFPLISRQLKLVRHSDLFCLHGMVGKLRAEGTSTFRDKVPSTADMYSVPAFLGTLPGYLLGQDIQPSSTSHRQKLQCKTHSRAQYATRMDSHTSHPVIYSKMPQKLPAEGTSMSTVQRGKVSQARQPNLLRQAIEAASSVRHPRLPRYATRRNLPGYGTQPSPASYPKLRQQATQPSSTRRQYLQRYCQTSSHEEQ